MEEAADLPAWASYRETANHVSRKDENPDAPAGKREAEGGVAQGAMAMIVKNRIMIYGPKDDGSYVGEFKTAQGTSINLVPGVRDAYHEALQSGCPADTSAGCHR